MSPARRAPPRRVRLRRRPTFTESSDVDVLVEFDPASQSGRFDTYFALKEGLEQILDRPVDVVTVTAVRNPYFLDEIMRTRQNLYAA